MMPESVERFKLAGLSFRARFGLSGVTPGERDELAFPRVSEAARPRRHAHAGSDSLERSAVIARCRIHRFCSHWPDPFSPAGPPSPPAGCEVGPSPQHDRRDYGCSERGEDSPTEIVVRVSEPRQAADRVGDSISDLFSGSEEEESIDTLSRNTYGSMVHQ